MKAKNAVKPLRAKPRAFVDETFRPLPYRPTRRLRRTAAPAYVGFGWKTAQFQDDLGNLYERERDGEWERWNLVLEQRGKRKKVLFKYQPERKAVEFDDALDRHDDLRFLFMAFAGLLDDAVERKVFGPLPLKDLRSEIRRLGDAIDRLRIDIEMLKVPQPVIH